MRASGLLCGVGIALGLSSFAAPAAADYPRTAPVRPFNLPDLAGLTAVGLDVQYTWWQVELPLDVEEELASTTFDLGADFRVAPHWVIVARVPVVHGDIDVSPDDGQDCCGLALGNVTLGARGLWSSLHDSGLRSVVGGELALSLASASDDGEGATAARMAAIARLPHDPGRYLPDTWTPRLVGHGQIYGDWFMAQLEGGLHLFLYDDDGGDDSDLGIRLALAAGVRATAELAFLAEINNMIFAGDDDTASSLDIGVRYGATGFVFGLRLYLPLDDAARDLDMLGVGADIAARF